jgi:hypothetical protein
MLRIRLRNNSLLNSFRSCMVSIINKAVTVRMSSMYLNIKRQYRSSVYLFCILKAVKERLVKCTAQFVLIAIPVVC